MRSLALFGAAVLSLFVGLALLAARSPFSVVFIAAAVVTIVVTAFSASPSAVGQDQPAARASREAAGPPVKKGT